MISTRFRVLPPSAAPLHGRDILAGMRALGRPYEAAEELRQRVQEKFGARHVFFATSGRAGLSAGLTALRRLSPDRDEVLLPAYTSFSVPSAVVNAGLKVSLYDLHPETLAPDMASLERAMGPRTLCVVACHLFGYPVDIEPLREMCRAGDVALFDDAAQAMGASIGGKLAGTMGDVGLFSLSRGKNITAVDGGIVLTDRDDLAEELSVILEEKRGGAVALVRNMANALALTGLLHPNAYWLPASLPFLNIGASIFDPQFEIDALDAFRVGLAASVLGRLEAINSGRRKTAAFQMEGLSHVKKVRTIRPLPEAEPVFLRLPLLPDSGSWPCEHVPENRALGVVRSYPLAIHEIDELKQYVSDYECRFPVASYLAANMVTLPTHIYVKAEDIGSILNFICDSN